MGCRVGAKNTLVKNYLALAERRGVTIEPLRTVTRVRPLDLASPEQGYAVTTVRNGPGVGGGGGVHRHGRAGRRSGRRVGHRALLHAMKVESESNSLPRISDRLGEPHAHELRGPGRRDDHPGAARVDLTRGVAITSSFHVDESTHLENVRYGKGPNAIGPSR